MRNARSNSSCPVTAGALMSQRAFALPIFNPVKNISRTTSRVTRAVKGRDVILLIQMNVRSLGHSFVERDFALKEFGKLCGCTYNNFCSAVSHSPNEVFAPPHSEHTSVQRLNDVIGCVGGSKEAKPGGYLKTFSSLLDRSRNVRCYRCAILAGYRQYPQGARLYMRHQRKKVDEDDGYSPCHDILQGRTTAFVRDV